MHKWPLSIHLVFDLFHDAYDPSLGHLLEENSLPIIAIFHSAKTSIAQANEALRDLVNSEVALAHNLNGKDGVPPFIEDHTSNSIPTYYDTHEPSLL